MRIVNFIKDWALVFSILLGIGGYRWFPKADFIMPYLLFFMLLFTFCRISPREIRFRRMHLWFLLIQILGSLLLYVVCEPFNHVAAECFLMCVLAPTAAASAVVTMKLGGNGATNASYVLLSSTMVAFVAPLLFPIIHPQPGYEGFWVACFGILRRIMPILIGPFVLAFILKIVWPKLHAGMAAHHDVSFYLWACCVVFATAKTTAVIVENKSALALEILMMAGACLLCLAQFWIGKRLGEPVGDSISGGQSLGQKNVVLALWMASAYLSHLSLAGLGSYIIWQNLVNSVQLYRKRQAEKA